MLCVCICVYMHHYDRHQSSRGTQGTGAPKRGTCPLLFLITTVIYYYDTLAAKDPKQRECKSFLLSLLLCSCCCSCCCCCGCCCWDRQTDRQTDLVMLFPLLLLVVSVAFACDCLCFSSVLPLVCFLLAFCCLLFVLISILFLCFHGSTPSFTVDVAWWILALLLLDLLLFEFSWGKTLSFQNSWHT